MNGSKLTTPPTVIRTLQHVNELGLVITVYNRERQHFDAYFQVYQTDHPCNAQNRTCLTKSEVWSDERAAVFQFDNWAKEKEAS